MSRNKKILLQLIVTFFYTLEKVAAVIPVTSIEVRATDSEATIALIFPNLLLKCLMKRQEESALI